MKSKFVPCAQEKDGIFSRDKSIPTLAYCSAIFCPTSSFINKVTNTGQRIHITSELRLL